MRLVEIAGHLIDPGKVSYVGPLIVGPAGTGFDVVIDSIKIPFRFRQDRRKEFLAAIESAQPEYRSSWSEVPPYDELIKAMGVEVQEASDALLGVEPTVFCRYWPQCPQRDESPVLGSICLMCAASGTREQYRQELEAKKAGEHLESCQLRAMPGLDSLTARTGAEA